MNLRELYPDVFAHVEANIADDFFADDGEPDDGQPVFSYIRQSLIEGLRTLDPGAVVMPALSIRLTGQRFAAGQITAEAAEILVHLQNEINAAAIGKPDLDIRATRH